MGRTFAALVAGVAAAYLASYAGILTYPILAVPLVLWLAGVTALAWLTSIARLLVMRASLSYVLRASSLEVNRGLARRKSLVVSPSGFSEMEVDQGIVGRILNYGSIEIRSQGSQQLTLRLVRDPTDVSEKIRSVMTTPMVRMAPGSPPPAQG